MTKYYLIYDDSCSLCCQGVKMVQDLDKRRQIRPVELSRPELPDRIPRPPFEAISEQLHLYRSDGKLWVGADATAQLAIMLHPSRALRCILALPGIMPVARRLYKVVARNRQLFRQHDKGDIPGICPAVRSRPAKPS